MTWTERQANRKIAQGLNDSFRSARETLVIHPDLTRKSLEEVLRLAKNEKRRTRGDESGETGHAFAAGTFSRVDGGARGAVAVRDGVRDGRAVSCVDLLPRCKARRHGQRYARP